ncbi:hypothetical protein CPB85DRAFT_788556 [Mucidula mucida]|nr:hypothetical protein CPB85DRAFT_788556 [Mucidula mucida]
MDPKLCLSGALVLTSCPDDLQGPIYFFFLITDFVWSSTISIHTTLPRIPPDHQCLALYDYRFRTNLQLRFSFSGMRNATRLELSIHLPHYCDVIKATLASLNGDPCSANPSRISLFSSLEDNLKCAPAGNHHMSRRALIEHLSNLFLQKSRDSLSHQNINTSAQVRRSFWWVPQYNRNPMTLVFHSPVLVD